MEDLVLTEMLNDFTESSGLPRGITPEAFEAFAASIVLQKFHACDVSEIRDVVTGGSQDGGIDAIAILVNGRPVNTSEDLSYFQEKDRRPPEDNATPQESPPIPGKPDNADMSEIMRHLSYNFYRRRSAR